jgi:hypothetical protein
VDGSKHHVRLGGGGSVDIMKSPSLEAFVTGSLGVHGHPTRSKWEPDPRNGARECTYQAAEGEARYVWVHMGELGGRRYFSTRARYGGGS